MNIWNVILESNTFNFIILVFVIIGLSIWLKTSSKLQNVVDGVKKQIGDSDNTKEKSIVELKEAEELLKTTDTEVDEIEANMKKSISLIQQSILKQENELMEALEQNTQKTLSSNENKAIQNLSKKTISASFELAKHHIVKLLENNPQYHQKFIEDSINELDGLKQ